MTSDRLDAALRLPGRFAKSPFVLPTGTQLGLVVPADPNLIGNRIYVQALVFDGVELRLTDATSATFVQ